MIDIRMWGKALTGIPRLDREGWERLDPIARWLVATRAAVFIMTATSCGIGGLLALRDGLLDGPRLVACMIGLVFAHATNNLINDLTDHRKGVDRDNYYRTMYGPQPLEHGLLSERQMFKWIAATGAIALAAGAYLVAETGMVTLTLLGIGAFFVLFYTWPLKYIGLGEPAVIAVWGPLMIGGTYYVVSGGHWSPEVALISLAYAIGPTTVLFGKHTDKLEQDRAKGIRTLPVLLGESLSRRVTVVLWISQLALTGLLVARGSLGWPLLATFLAVPTLRKVAAVFARPRPQERPEEFPASAWPLYLSAHAFVYNRRFGLLFLGALLVDVLLRR
ncbi:MAG: prenyltransferase [Myxococcales bacterium]|nr:prenyltransferase [Myxococcales bacterium]MCB9701737.1 prenyltransferase [Myxococcales bacterium]